MSGWMQGHGDGMTTAGSCPDDAILDQLHKGEIDALALERLAGHLDTCAACGERLHQRFLTKNETGRVVAEQHDSLARQYARDKSTPVESPRWLCELLARGPALAKPALSRPLEPGDLGSLGRYRVLRVLGAGASSVVYQGFDPMLERMVVLKAYRPDYAGARPAFRICSRRHGPSPACRTTMSCWCTRSLRTAPPCFW